MSGTVKRGRTRARLVITLDVEVADAYLQTLPAYRRDAISVLRDRVEIHPSVRGILNLLGRWHKRGWISVIEEKMEVAG